MNCSGCQALTAQRDTAWDALREIETIMRTAGSDSSMLDGIAAVVSNGPLDTAPGGPREDECHRLMGERDRYRDALEDIAVFGPSVLARIDNHYSDRRLLDESRNVARAALNGERKDTE